VAGLIRRGPGFRPRSTPHLENRMSIRRSRIAAAPAALLLLLVAGAPGCSRETTAPEGAGAPEAASGPDAPAAAPSPVPATAPEAVAPATSATPAAAAPGTPGAEPVIADADLPAVVARVDGKDVTREDLLSRAAEARGALAQRGVPPPPSTRSFYRSVINDLVGNALLYRELEVQGKAAPAADVDAQFAAMRSRFASDAEFDAAIAQRGFDRERLRREIAESLTVQKWVTETVMPTLAVTEAEAREFYVLNEERRRGRSSRSRPRSRRPRPCARASPAARSSRRSRPRPRKTPAPVRAAASSAGSCAARPCQRSRRSPSSSSPASSPTSSRPASAST